MWGNWVWGNITLRFKVLNAPWSTTLLDPVESVQSSTKMLSYAVTSVNHARTMPKGSGSLFFPSPWQWSNPEEDRIYI